MRRSKSVLNNDVLLKSTLLRWLEDTSVSRRVRIALSGKVSLCGINGRDTTKRFRKSTCFIVPSMVLYEAKSGFKFGSPEDRKVAKTFDKEKSS